MEAQDATTPLALITKTALTSGQSITTDGATIIVGDAVPGGGFSIQVETIETGQLLSYGDDGAPGNVSDPVVVGFGGWLQFKFLFAGVNQAGESRIYAVNQAGELLSYGDDGAPGNVSDPVVVGFGGWLQFKFLFAGVNQAGESRIYAVNQAGELLSYGDDGAPGNVSDPVVVGFGGWLQFKFLFAGVNQAGENRIYAVNQAGESAVLWGRRGSWQCLRPGRRRLRRMAAVQVSLRRSEPGRRKSYLCCQPGRRVCCPMGTPELPVMFRTRR